METHTDSALAPRRRERARTPAARRPAKTPAAIRKRKERAHHKNGEHHYRLWLSDRAVEGLILKCILEGRLTEAQAMEPKLVDQALAESRLVRMRSGCQRLARRASPSRPFLSLSNQHDPVDNLRVVSLRRCLCNLAQPHVMLILKRASASRPSGE